MAKIIGIDLGTTFSAAAMIEAGEPRIIENKEGERTTPSVVAITKSGERLVGRLARRQQITNPENTIFAIKRLMGRKFDDPVVQKNRDKLSYETRRAENGGVEVKMGNKWYKPPEISAMILQKIKRDLEEKLGQKIEEAVITCPAYFDNSQRKATKEAGEIAGFKVKRVFNEPTAAALAYGLTRKKDEQIVVYDLGGGTFDISVLQTSKDTVEVIATGGDMWLGGEDFDHEIMEWIIEKFKNDEGIDLGQDKLAKQRIKEAAEKAKIELSSRTETEINLPFVTSDQQGPKHLDYTLTRAKLEELVDKYIERSIDLVKKTLEDANLKPEDIDDVILVGGQTRMPKVREEVKKLFNKEPNQSINPDEVVAIGAAVQAGIFEGDMKDVLLLDVTPLSLGIETLGGITNVLIPKNTTIPTSKERVFSTAADNQTSVEIHVVQGERTLAKDNKTLGRFILDGIPPAPRGVPKVEVSFDIDANGILEVSAKDKGTNKSQSIRIEGSSGLSEEELEKMKKEAEEHAREDERKRKLIETKNKAEALIYTSQKTLKDFGDKIDKPTKEKVEQEIKSLEKAAKEENIETIENNIASLSKAIQEIGAKIYESKQGPNNPEKNEPEAEEGEYKEKK